MEVTDYYCVKYELCSEFKTKLRKHVCCCFHTNRITALFIYISKCSLPLKWWNLYKNTLLLICKEVKFPVFTVLSYK